MNEIMEVTLWLASDIEEEIRPVARVSAVVVSQSFVAGHFFGLSEGAAVEVQIAAGRCFEQTESVLAVRRAVTTRFRFH